MKTFTKIGTEIGELVEQKNAAYGSSFAVAGSFLRLLFPSGVPADRFDDALLMVRIFDKQMRIATDKDAFGESPYADIAGYGILGTQLHQQRKESKTCQGSANGQNASSSPKAQPVSADPSTRATTTTSESERTESAPSLQRESFFAVPRDANAQIATDAASRSVDVQVKRFRRNNFHHSYECWLHRHNNLRCIACEESVMGMEKSTVLVHTHGGMIQLSTCSTSCSDYCVVLLKAHCVEGAYRP